MQLKEELGGDVCVHMDPIAQNDETINQLKAMTVQTVVELLGENTTIHDFRMVEGHTHTNLLFDVVVPYDIDMTDAQVKEAIKECISCMGDCCYRAVVTVDHQYI